MTTRRMTRELALRVAAGKWWEGKDPFAVVRFQLWQSRLCMPFGLFHEAVEKCLGRAVMTHEFGLATEDLRDEFMAAWRRRKKEVTS